MKYYIVDGREYSCWLFQIMSIFAYIFHQKFNTLAFEMLFIVSYLNHKKSINSFRIQQTIHIIDTIYAHIIAIYYTISSLYWLFLTYNIFFISSVLNACIISIYIYKKTRIPKMYVHIFVFIGCMSYIFGIEKSKNYLI
jgi:hypothetical protein